jgi:hypothetical protein
MLTDSEDYPFEFEYALLLDRSGVNIAQLIGQRIREAAAAQNPTQSKPEGAAAESVVPEENKESETDSAAQGPVSDSVPNQPDTTDTAEEKR